MMQFSIMQIRRIGMWREEEEGYTSFQPSRAD